MARGAPLYLRGLPEALVREAKAAAARRGITLTALVEEALQRLVAVPADNDAASEGAKRTPEATAALASLADSMRRFEENRRRLLRRYRGQYVAIDGRRVIDHDRDFDALARRVFARVGVRPVLMPKVTADDRVISVPSPRRGGR